MRPLGGIRNWIWKLFVTAWPATFTLVAIFAFNGQRARADAALLMEEPFGTFGGMNPTGHAAIYLNHLCAASPTQLRACNPGEYGVVISRYHRVGGKDWLAIPLLPYLYAVEQIEDVPSTADAALEEKLRDEYRRKYLQRYAPTIADGDAEDDAPEGEWIELIGSSYDRWIYGFQIQTTAEQDDAFMARFNDRRNVSHFNLFFSNCADFSRNLLNEYYPHAVRRNYLIDVGMTTPKQVARSLTKYAKRHPELQFKTFQIPQVPGSIPRSHAIRGVVESLLTSKRYIVPLAILRPEFTAGMIVAYLADGRFKLPKDAEMVIVPGQHDIELAGQQRDALPPSPVPQAVQQTFQPSVSQTPAVEHGQLPVSSPPAGGGRDPHGSSLP